MSAAVEVWGWGVALVILGVIFRLIYHRLDVLPLFYRFGRRELPKTTITLQPSSPARPLSLRAAKGLQPSNVVPMERGRIFGTSKAEWERTTKRFMRAETRRVASRGSYRVENQAAVGRSVSTDGGAA